MNTTTTTNDQALIDALLASPDFEVFQPITWERRVNAEQVVYWIALVDGIRGIISKSERLGGWVVTVSREGDDEEFEMSIQDTRAEAVEVGNVLIRDLA